MSELLDLSPGVGQVASELQFRILSPSLDVIGSVSPLISQASITNNTASNLVRSLRGVTLRQDDAAAVNMFVDRIMPVWVLEDGSGVQRFGGWPLGVFMFSYRARHRGSLHVTTDVTLVDQGFQLDQPLAHATGVSEGGSLYQAMVKLVRDSGIQSYEIDPVEQIAGPGGVLWPINTRQVSAMRKLGTLGGWAPPYFDNQGVLRVKVLPTLVEGEGHSYTLDGVTRIYEGTIQEVDNLLDAPNVYVVLGSGVTTTQTVARAYIDPRLPHSVENIHYERPRVVTMQGLVDSSHAQRVADGLAAVDPSQLQVVDFTAAPDPRHDTFDQINFGRVAYREVMWELELAPGGSHRHRGVKQISEDNT